MTEKAWVKSMSEKLSISLEIPAECAVDYLLKFESEGVEVMLERQLNVSLDTKREAQVVRVSLHACLKSFSYIIINCSIW